MEITLAASLIFSPLLTFHDVKDYFSDVLGQRRFYEIVEKYHVKIPNSNYIRERELAKILIAASEPCRQDLQEVIDGLDSPLVSVELKERLKQYSQVEELPREAFHELYDSLTKIPSQRYKLNMDLDTAENGIIRMIHFWASFFRYDPIWGLAERKRCQGINETLSKERFYERLTGYYCTSEDLEVGQYIRSFDDEGTPQYLKIMGKLVTGGGQNTWIYQGATQDTNLPTIRASAGTPGTPSGLDTLSFYITDFEEELGRLAYESGLAYEETMRKLFNEPIAEMGYSVGGVMAQYRTAEHPETVNELWTFKSPGIPKDRVETFRNKVQECDHEIAMHVYIAKRDLVDFAGDCHIGCDAPSNVSVSLTMMTIPAAYPHAHTSRPQANVELDKIETDFEKYLNNHGRSKVETYRQKFGKNFAVPVLKKVKKVSHFVFPNRIHTKKGFSYEAWSKDGQWCVERIVC